MPRHAFCSIVPPYVLEALATSGDAALERRARATLEHDETLREQRRAPQQLREAAPAPAGERPPAEPDRGGPSRRIHDCGGRQVLPGAVVRREEEPATGDETVTEAYDGLGATWELWHAAYDRDSLDDKGLPLVASVHYGTGYDNAFWNGRQMVFGDGDGEIFLSFTRSVDVIGHELAHGVTQYTSGLNYEGQSGALNESISDVFGVLVKQRLLGHSAADADWLIGAELLAPGVKGRALRDMAAPGTAYDDPRLGKDPQPAHMDAYVETSADNGGVHINSGIPNRAFVLVARELGGNAWEDAGAIWVATITGDIRADCDFATFARLTHEAAVSEFGAESAQADAVSSAWKAVGVTASAKPARKKVAKAKAKAPAGPKAPSPTTEVSVTRTGGIAGLVKERTVALGDLPRKDTKAWQGLLAQPAGLRALAQEPGHPDAYAYGIACAEPRVEVSIAEPALPEDIRALLERTLSARSIWWSIRPGGGLPRRDGRLSPTHTTSCP
ncbi:MAG: M4 family metallopeptidase [Phycicoccus sp.]|uniref:protealysin inhibitor emfourin n=1 Tax=Phycicoccus sp. TaxID=1902410 RepID=UPI00258FD57B|nr:protealysin inhibitor emfourin [Phycicoccus sp.]MCO5303783.1 M4 family metallopeptidase [Phycicoccus sp.]